MENDGITYREFDPLNISSIPEVVVELLSSSENPNALKSSTAASYDIKPSQVMSLRTSSISSSNIEVTSKKSETDGMKKDIGQTSSASSINQEPTVISSAAVDTLLTETVKTNLSASEVDMQANASSLGDMTTIDFTSLPLKSFSISAVVDQATETTNAQSLSRHEDHDHRALGSAPFLQPTESAAILASVFVGVAVIGYAALVIWRKVLE